MDDALAMMGLVSGAGIVAACVRAEVARRDNLRLQYLSMRARALVELANARYQPQFPNLQTWHGSFPVPPAPPALPLPTVADMPTPEKPAIPTFAEMQRDGLVQPGPELVIGYRADGSPRWGSWLELYNLLMLGLSGYGKSTAARYLACWHVLNGGKLVIIDPHGKSGDESLLPTLAPLASAFLCDPATDAAGAIRALRVADAEMRGRLNGERPATWPLLVIIDELKEAMTYSAWAPAAPAIAEYLSVGNTAGRKRKCYGMGLAQTIYAADLTPQVQQSFVSSAAFRSKRRQAQMLDFEPEEKRQIQRLPIGGALFMGARDTAPELLYFPNTTADDGARLATQMADARLYDGYSVATAPASDVAVDMPEVATVAVSADAQRATDLFMGGANMAEIVNELRGVRSNQGAKYQQALAEIQQLVRDGLRKG